MPEDTDTTIKTKREMLAGGVESGMPCACGEMTRWVQTVSALRMMEEAHFDLTPEQRTRLATEGVAILACPKCERITQAPESAARRMRAAYEARRLTQ